MRRQPPHDVDSKRRALSLSVRASTVCHIRGSSGQEGAGTTSKPAECCPAACAVCGGFLDLRCLRDD
eukprot:CAMPEP_0178380752 /NCGR_PEP_ID=MMETSP0689_2-20121128/5627_1 /TAXON_ID=160604 /ORGANISM="Amphidinium massartii, Strain CS-259" /LENGTH=66 /DNA_ID=CAMNT_0020000909 /DNA_START=639 /DNA_END=836 /DNA_ORIENTATION=-